jgi:hypothetical protein
MMLQMLFSPKSQHEEAITADLKLSLNKYRQMSDENVILRYSLLLYHFDLVSTLQRNL